MSSGAAKAMKIMAAGIRRIASNISIPRRRLIRRRSTESSGSASPPASQTRKSVGAGQKRKRQSLNESSRSKRRAITSASSAASPQVARRPCPGEAEEAAAAVGSFPLAALAAGPYLGIAAFLDSKSLCSADAACRLLRGLNNLQTGPWQTFGERSYYGLELDIPGGFQSFEKVRVPGSSDSESWKARCAYFRTSVPHFSSPFSGHQIKRVDTPDEVAYCRTRLRTDLLAVQPDRGVYVEVDVFTNADNLSLAVVDFEGGGRSSVTFSPETGAVLRERKVREQPRAIEGTYIHLLSSAAQGRRFEGTMGLYLKGGHIAFFRRWAVGSPGAGERKLGNWETTGFCTDLKWAQGPRLSLCLAFRDSGSYKVEISQVSSDPPFTPKPHKDAYQDSKWSLLYGDDDHPLAI
eukprot:TRINITY_DN31250_c0_g1_i1.p1 TRINITY_DN31250_c0_g1~~TRINITY_DN31250_c0_g1_i1.p1  ORF type:complete len:407 (-),score=53.03 TRINITY_DN31250_c0_g1_i1:340-1560(-)